MMIITTKERHVENENYLQKTLLPDAHRFRP